MNKKLRVAEEARVKAEQEAEAARVEEAKVREEAKADKQPAPAPQPPESESTSKPAPAPQPDSKPDSKPDQGGREIYVEATAYTADPLENGYKPGEHVYSAMGHDLTANSGMKLIAVDPRVIPLGSRVYVEGYGTAIAGDTGGAIKGHRIDVLMPDKASSSAWGRRQVRVVIL